MQPTNSERVGIWAVQAPVVAGQVEPIGTTVEQP